MRSLVEKYHIKAKTQTKTTKPPLAVDFKQSVKYEAGLHVFSIHSGMTTNMFASLCPREMLVSFPKSLEWKSSQMLEV